MHFSDLAENAEHIVLRTEFDLKIICCCLNIFKNFFYHHPTEIVFVSMFLVLASLG